MPAVLDRDTGQPVNVSPEEAQAGILSGKFALDADAGPVTLKGADGKSFTAKDSQAAVDALATGRFSLPSQHEETVEQVRAREKAGGFERSAEHFAESAGNQFLLGAPAALTEAGESPEMRERREAAEEYHHAARLAGGAVGIGASLLAGGGGIFKAADLAGQAVERGVLPAAELGEAALARRLTASAANYATQGAILSSPKALIEATIGGDPKKAAETLAWGIGPGALLGGGAELLKAGAGAALGRLGEALDTPSASEALEKFASDRTAKAFGAERSQLNKLSTERIRDVTDFAHERGLIEAGMSRKEIGEAVHAAHAEYGQKIGDVIDTLDETMRKGTATEDLTAHAIKPGELGDAIKSALDSPELRMPMNADQARALDMVVDSANKMKSTFVNGREVIDFKTAQDFVSSLRRKWVNSIGKDLNEGGVRGIETVTPLDEMKSAAYQAARDALDAATQRMGVAAKDPELAGALAKAKADYSKVAELEKWVATRERQEAGNRMVGLTDFMHMGQGPISGVLGAAGTGLGAAIGGPAGAMIGGAIAKPIGGILDLLAKHWAEDKGLVALSAIAKRAAKEGPEVFSAVMASEGAKRLEATMGGVRDTVRNLAVRGIEEAGTRTQDHMKALLGSTNGLTPDQSYAKLSRRLTELGSNPAAATSLTAAASAPFAAASPMLGAAYQAQLMRTLDYLYNAVPKAPEMPMPFAPQDWEPSHADKLAFHDKAEVVANPMALMKHLSSGTLSDAHLDAAQAIYPQILQQMRSEVLSMAAKHEDLKLPLPERDSVAKLLGGTVAFADHLQQLQATYGKTAQPQQPGPGAARPPKGKLKKVPEMGTTFAATQGPSSTGA